MSRVGTFSSSEIHKLMSKGRGAFSIDNIGKPFTTYVQEKKYERKLGRSLTVEQNSKPTTWGTLVEEFAFEKMDLKYSLVSKDRFYHKKHPEFWSGVPDIITDDMIGDIKCPFTLKSFCELVDIIEAKDVEKFKTEKPEYYWQLISNAILAEKDKAVFIAFCPFKEDLEKIRELAESKMDELNRFAWINWAFDDQLPYLLKEKGYTDLNLWEFEIPKKDKELLTLRVERAINLIK